MFLIFISEIRFSDSCVDCLKIMCNESIHEQARVDDGSVMGSKTCMCSADNVFPNGTTVAADTQCGKSSYAYTV